MSSLAYAYIHISIIHIHKYGEKSKTPLHVKKSFYTGKQNSPQIKPYLDRLQQYTAAADCVQREVGTV